MRACKISLSPGRLRVWVVYKYPLPLPPLIHFLAFKRGQVAQLLSFANVNLLCRALFLWAVACQRPCVGSSLEIRDLCIFFFFWSREGVSHQTWILGSIQTDLPIVSTDTKKTCAQKYVLLNVPLFCDVSRTSLFINQYIVSVPRLCCSLHSIHKLTTQLKCINTGLTCVTCLNDLLLSSRPE